MKGAWAVFVVITSVASNPVMKYSFCPMNNEGPCEPTFRSNSSLEFGNMATGVFYYDFGRNKQEVLSVSCTFHQPLHWILTSHTDAMIFPASNNIILNGSHLQYYYHIEFRDARAGLIRCESYSNPDLAAEIFIAQREPNNKYFRGSHKLLEFIPRAIPQLGGQLIVPCTMYRFDPKFDAQTIWLKKLKRSDMLAPNVTRECVSCFPNLGGHSEAYAYDEDMWDAAGKRLITDVDPWRSFGCLENPECKFETATKAPKPGKSDCNGDGEITCSDHFNAFTSYPSNCTRDHTSFRNFRKIEACVVKNSAQLLNSTEADYDPRVGFRLKKEKDMDAVYVCPSPAVYYSPYNLATKMDARLQTADYKTEGPFRGIFCIVQQKWMENVEVKFLLCQTLFECEIQLKTVEGEVFFRDYAGEVVDSIPISEISDGLYGRIIQRPPSSGIVYCKGKYEFNVGYIWDLQYYFTGLDSKSCTCNMIPAKAVISLKKQWTDANGTQIVVTCAVATFIVYPSFDFRVEYLNGTIISKTEQTTYEREHLWTGPVSNNASTVKSIICRARYRSSGKHVEAKLTIQPAVEPALVDTKKPPEAGSNFSQIYLVVIFSVAIIFVLLLTASCCICQRNAVIIRLCGALRPHFPTQRPIVL